MILGIDPGCGTTGIALVENGKLFKHKTMKGSDALLYIVDLHKVYKYDRAVVERPKQAVFYARHATKKNAVVTPAGVIKLAQNVGMNIKLTQDIIEKLRSIGVRVKEVNPRRGSTKWNKGFWLKIFSWKGRLPSEHARDASIHALQWERRGEWYA